MVAASEGGKMIENLAGCAADVSTMRRWVRQFKDRGPATVGWLLSTLLTVYEQQFSLLEAQNKSLLKQLARLLREYTAIYSGGVIGKANIILTTRNCGFL